MRSKLAGHALQLLGYTLTFLGLGVAVVALFLAGNYPTVPLWVFLAAGVAVGAPLMIAGGRIDGRGRGRVLELSPEEAAREYTEKTLLTALHLGLGFLLTALVIAPVLLQATGWVHPSDVFTKVWIIGWMLALCACRDWITRPLWRSIEGRVIARRMGQIERVPGGNQAPVDRRRFRSEDAARPPGRGGILDSRSGSGRGGLNR
jgi:hypothetical protein